MTKPRSALFCVLFTSLVALISCQGVAQKGAVLREGKMRVVKLIIADWENGGTGARVRSTLLGLDGVLNISEIPRIGQVTVTYDQSKVTLEQMEKALNEKGVAVTQRNWLEEPQTLSLQVKLLITQETSFSSPLAPSFYQKTFKL